MSGLQLPPSRWWSWKILERSGNLVTFSQLA